MLVLRGHGLKTVPGENADGARILRLSADANRPAPLRKSEGYISRHGEIPSGFAWYLFVNSTDIDAQVRNIPAGVAAIFLPQAFDYLESGDVVRLSANRGDISVLYRRQSPHNSFLLTERCNNYCLMCSQPPRNVNDGWIVSDILTAIPLIAPETREIGFTGGEPTLLGNRLIDLIKQMKAYLPFTGLHILSNGRAFADGAFAEKFASTNHPDLMVGIPIYSDLSEIHDYVVQADGAFDETIRGVLNLKRFRQKVEIRVVIHKQTYERLPELARFIARNLTFVDQVVLMGLEMMGFTKANLEELWIDPLDYQPQLAEAVKVLSANRVKASVYNHQLCITDKSLWPVAKKSISDWKNDYMPECNGCEVKDQCAGFFSSATLRYSSHIHALKMSESSSGSVLGAKRRY